MENFNRENHTFKYFIDLEEIINMSDDELIKLIEKKNRI